MEKATVQLKESLDVISEGLDRMQKINDESIRLTQDTIELVKLGQSQLAEMIQSNDNHMKMIEETLAISNETSQLLQEYRMRWEIE